jgi:hypothetical protein
MIIRNDNITEASLGSSSDLNASAFLSKLISSGGVVNSTVVNAVNNLFLDLKSSGLYSKVRRLYPMVGSTRDTCSLEAKLTGDNITWNESAGFVFNANGITCDGYTSRNPATLGKTPYQIFGTDNNLISFCLYSRTSRGAAANFPLSASVGGSNNYFQLNIDYSDTGHVGAIGKESMISSPVTSTQGLFMVSRVSDSLQTLYRNGVSLATNTATGNTLASSSTIGLFDYTDDNFAFASLNDGFTDAEAYDFYTIVQNFQTSLGRQV